MTTPLPRGVWYDAPRKRFRVRLYRGTAVVYLNYHKTAEGALEDYERARASFQLIEGSSALHTVDDQVAALRRQFIDD